MKARLAVLDVDYTSEDGVSVIRIWGRAENGKSMVCFDRGFESYFYVEPKKEVEIDGLKREIENVGTENGRVSRVEVVGRKVLGREVKMLKVFSKTPGAIQPIRDIVKEWEAVKEEYEYTISTYKRYILDKGISPTGWIEVEGEAVESKYNIDLAINITSLKVLDSQEYPEFSVAAIDIETVRRGSEDIIVMISVYSDRKSLSITYGNAKSTKRAMILSDEAGMLKEFLNVLNEINPDILVGYNSDRFDFVKIEDRLKKYGIEFMLGRDISNVLSRRRGQIYASKIKGMANVDVFGFIDTILGSFMETDVFSLNNVAREIIGEGKKDLSMEEIENLWKNGDLKSLSRHCMKDSELTLKLADVVLPQIYEMCRITSQTLFDASRMSYSQLVESLLMRKAFESGEYIPNRPRYDEVERRKKMPPYEGGYVHQPKEGIHEKLALLDFASLYPSITVTHNISPDTLDCICCREKEESPNRIPDYDHFYCSSHRGFIPEMLEKIMGMRKELKMEMSRKRLGTHEHLVLNNRQNALKILSNAIYGYYAYPGSRWYSRVCAESIARLGRGYIKKVIEMAKKEGMDTIYGDTDSLFLKMKTKKSVNDFVRKVNDSLPGVMEIELRGFYKTGIFVLTKAGTAAKKRYALMTEDGKIIIKGFERVRRDWSAIARETQEKVLDFILREKSPEKAVVYVRKIVSDIRNEKVRRDRLVIYTQITKSIDDYEQIGPHVSAAKKLVKMGIDVKPGFTVGYIISEGEGSIASRAEPVQVTRKYDKDYYINNQVLPAALRILSSLGYNEDNILDKRIQKQSSLKGFFK